MLASVSLPRPRSELRAEESEAVSDSNMAAPWRGKREPRVYERRVASQKPRPISGGMARELV